MIAKRSDKQVPLRVPDGVLRRIDAAAKNSGRSRNSEILVRLTESFRARRSAAASVSP